MHLLDDVCTYKILNDQLQLEWLSTHFEIPSHDCRVYMEQGK